MTNARSSRIAFAAIACSTAVGALAVLAGFGTSLTPTAASAQYGPPPPGKVTICHHVKTSKSTRHVTIRVSPSAVRAHLRHGDTLAACSTSGNKVAHAKPAHAKKWHKKRR